MPAKRKFNVGDNVVVSLRCPDWILDEIRYNRVRTIVEVSYSPTQQHTLYRVGTNLQGFDPISDYGFRADQLKHPVMRRAGKPRQKRQYIRWNKGQTLAGMVVTYLMNSKPSVKALNSPPCITNTEYALCK